MGISIKSATFTNAEKTQILTWVSVDGGDPFPFFVATQIEDESEIWKYIMTEYQSGRLVPEEFVEDEEKLCYDARFKRNRLLTATDYLVSPDYPITDEQRAALKAYRQGLRDITSQNGFPRDIVWPEKPEFIK